MKIVNRRVLGTTIGLALAATACRDSVAAEPRLSALYVLETVNDQALPATAAQGGGQQYIILADTLRFQLDGRVLRTTAIRWISTSPRALDTFYINTVAYPYTIDGEVVTIGYTGGCAPNADCVGWEQGTITAAGLVVRDRIHWPAEPKFVFARR